MGGAGIQHHPSQTLMSQSIINTSNDQSRDMLLVQNSKNSFSSKKGSLTHESELNLTNSVAGGYSNRSAAINGGGGHNASKNHSRYLNQSYVAAADESASLGQHHTTNRRVKKHSQNPDNSYT